MPDYLRATISMRYDTYIWGALKGGYGEGGVDWQAVAPCAELPDDLAKIGLACLHYGRILAVHKESRPELFQRVGQAAQALADGEPEAGFEPWSLQAGDANFSLWPWTLSNAHDIEKPKTYVATLRAKRPRELSVHLKMAWGLERMLAPGSVLVVLTTLAAGLDEAHRRLLGRALLAMNAHYEIPERAAGPGKETKAFTTVLPILNPDIFRESENLAEAEALDRTVRQAAARERGKQQGRALAWWVVIVVTALLIGALLTGAAAVAASIIGAPLAPWLLGFWFAASLVGFAFVWRRVGGVKRHLSERDPRLNSPDADLEAVLHDYGAVLERYAGYTYGVSERLLPHPRALIESAFRVGLLSDNTPEVINSLEVGYLYLSNFLEEPLGTEAMQLKEQIVLPEPDDPDPAGIEISLESMLSPEGKRALGRSLELLKLIQVRGEEIHREIEQLRQMRETTR